MPPPPGWLKGLKELLDRHGILLVCDEVMCGWGRTGKLFAFEHYDVVPDILTMAKGLTSSYIPLGCMALSDEIAAHFQDNVFWGGLTYNSHALALATAEAVIDVMVGEGMVDNAAPPATRLEFCRKSRRVIPAPAESAPLPRPCVAASAASVTTWSDLLISFIVLSPACSCTQTAALL